jgi:hypothetical protein
VAPELGIGGGHLQNFEILAVLGSAFARKIDGGILAYSPRKILKLNS